MDELERRRRYTKDTLEQLREKMANAPHYLASNACICVIGSFGRGEASQFSDADAFIVGKSEPVGGTGGSRSLLRPLDAICVKAEMVKAVRQLGIRDFDGDGRYLISHHVNELIETLGTPNDDVVNTFTHRLLLLLEGYPVVGEDVYDDITQLIIAKYWRDYGDHEDDFVPGFLANDILRLWRTFCVNYEARTSAVSVDEKAKRRVKNYKLKHSRLLTCYSALIYLLFVFGRDGTVSPKSAISMIKMTPTQRLEELLKERQLDNAHSDVKECLTQYNLFLEATNRPEPEMQDAFKDKRSSQEQMETAKKCGDALFRVLNIIGGQNAFHRILVV